VPLRQWSHHDHGFFTRVTVSETLLSGGLGGLGGLGVRPPEPVHCRPAPRLPRSLRLRRRVTAVRVKSTHDVLGRFFKDLPNTSM
jgi:hypothetical protein